MSKHLESVRNLLKEGTRLVVVQDREVRPYMALLAGADPAGWERPRPVLSWDSDDGFVAPAEYADPLPPATELVDALEFVRSYLGEAIFLIDARQSDFHSGEPRLRKTCKQLGMTLGNRLPVVAVIVTAGPIPPSIAEHVAWVGDEPVRQEAGTASPRAKAPSKSARVSDEYHDIRHIEKFDTAEWEDRLNCMTPDEVLRIVEVGAYRDALERMRELRDSLKKRFARKDAVIEAVCAATIAQVSTVLIGPPGTAKSNLIRCFCEGLGLTAHQDSHPGNGHPAGRRYFEYLLTRYTTPEEIFGPIHVQDLIDRQIYRRVTDGYLPQAQIAFLDEIFKASSAILNTLLTLLNERIFYNGGKADRVPLMMVFAASNEAPAEDNLQALYDRFPLRLNCPPVADEHVGELLNAAWQQAYDRQFSLEQVSIHRCACTNDLRLLRHVIRVKFGGRATAHRSRTGFDFDQEFLRFFRSLRNDFAISDRTSAPLLAFCRAQAFLNNQTDLTPAELDVFKHVAWDDSGTGELDRLVNNMKRGIRI